MTATLETGIFSYLSTYAGLTALVGTRLYPLKRPQGTPFPAVTYQKVSGVRGYTLTGPDGLPHATIQFSCWAEAYDTYTTAAGLTIVGVRNVAAQVIAAFDGYSGTMGGIQVGSAFVVSDTDLPASDLPEAEIGLYHAMVEVTFAYAEP